jgi:hypothetical protein
MLSKISLDRISVDDQFGRVFLRVPDGKVIDGYFQTLKLLDSFVLGDVFLKHVTGFYINVSNGLNSVRLSYFTSDSSKTLQEINESVKRTSLEKFREERPQKSLVSQEYGGEELRFRKYLFIYTLIGLDSI